MSNEQIANCIIQQLGGFGKLSAMISASQYIYGITDNNENFLQFKFKGSKKYNKIVITLTQMDTYTLQFYKLTKDYNFTPLVTKTDIYCDELIECFTSVTGLDLFL
jgi:hypothetical protein